MKKLLFGVIIVIMGVSAYFARSERSVEKMVIVHDTICIDTQFITKRDTVFFNAQWLRKQFEISPKAYWKNYGDRYEVEYPEFMNKVLLNKGERNLKVEYHGVSMVVTAYDDEFEMSVLEKYEALNMSAVTKSVADSSFLLAGQSGKNKFYFEKEIKLKDRTWMYLRVEFPQELTWAVDPLLHYVKDYEPEG